LLWSLGSLRQRSAWFPATATRVKALIRAPAASVDLLGVLTPSLFTQDTSWLQLALLGPSLLRCRLAGHGPFSDARPITSNKLWPAVAWASRKVRPAGRNFVHGMEGAHDPADRPIFIESDVDSSDSSAEEEEVASVPGAPSTNPDEEQNHQPTGAIDSATALPQLCDAPLGALAPSDCTDPKGEALPTPAPEAARSAIHQ
jgi:hypothetical protein